MAESKAASLQEEVADEPTRARVAWEYFSTLVVMALVVFSCRSVLADWYVVPSGSMLPTIQLGDRIFVNKLAYDLRVPFTSISLARLGEPKRGDIVVFVYPVDNRTDYVKRLVGLPGDRVEIRNNILYVNDEAMTRWAVGPETLPPQSDLEPGEQLFRERLGDVEHFVLERRVDSFRLSELQTADEPTLEVVPDDMYLMMGDNRDNSSDSRVWGFVPRKNLRGRALRVVLSFTPTDNSSPVDVVKGIFTTPFRGRWQRTFLDLNP
jgi:signal peptidase I